MGVHLPPFWKIKRELKRFPISVMSKARASLGPLHRIRHDLTAHRTVRVIDGDRPVAPEVAIFLIYQPGDFLDSLFLTLDHLIEKGMAVILVANHPIDAEKEALLRPYCFRMIERPNIGYDFGGYREGVLYALREKLLMERLFLLNDSNWFPITEDSDLIDAARASVADIYGVFLGSPRKRERDTHLQSYFYRFNLGIVSDPRFERYWKKMPLIEEKRLVVRHREVGLSRHFRELGFTLGSYHARPDVLAAAMALSDDELMLELDYLRRIDYFREGIQRRLTENLPELLKDRQQLAELLEEGNFSFNYLGNHPVITLGSLNSPIIKKNRDPEFREMRREIKASALSERLLPVVRRELGTWDK